MEERQRLIYALERAYSVYHENRDHVQAMKHVIHNLFAAMADVGQWNREHPDEPIAALVDGKVPAGDLPGVSKS